MKKYFDGDSSPCGGTFFQETYTSAVGTRPASDKDDASFSTILGGLTYSSNCVCAQGGKGGKIMNISELRVLVTIKTTRSSSRGYKRVVHRRKSVSRLESVYIYRKDRTRCTPYSISRSAFME